MKKCICVWFYGCVGLCRYVCAHRVLYLYVYVTLDTSTSCVRGEVAPS